MDNQETVTREEYLKAYRIYKRDWRKRNPDKVRAANERYWLKQAAKIKAREEEQQNGKSE